MLQRLERASDHPTQPRSADAPAVIDDKTFSAPKPADAASGAVPRSVAIVHTKIPEAAAPNGHHQALTHPRRPGVPVRLVGRRPLVARGPVLSTTTARNAPPASGADAVRTRRPSPLKPANNAARSVAAGRPGQSGTQYREPPAGPAPRRPYPSRTAVPSGTAAAEYPEGVRPRIIARRLEQGLAVGGGLLFRRRPQGRVVDFQLFRRHVPGRQQRL